MLSGMLLNHPYIKSFLKAVLAFFILVFGFIAFYSFISADDPDAQFNLDAMIDYTVAWVDYDRYRKELEHISHFDQIEVEYIGDTTRLNFALSHLDYFLETRFDKYFKGIPYVDWDKWMIPGNDEYREIRRRVIGGDPDDAMFDEIGKMWITFKTWRISDRTVYYSIRFYVGTEKDIIGYSDFRVGNTKRTVMIHIFEKNVDMMTRVFAQKFFYLRREPHKAPKVEKI
ncbi:MAG: hypothetical protein P9L92_17325 [Candidatus Electryonea clarkiae]|nr:hypothetical protein [Candidatus Electryonea clarkiae]MDP8286298.1 hypothetical protein [Candidatus Electryonea clarkiae]